MTEQYDERLLKTIFSDAHVIDVDFSQWDKAISLGVVADHVKPTTPGRLPIFVVEFLRVQRFSCDFNHLKANLGDYFDEQTMHIQWRIASITIASNSEGLVSVSLSEDGIFPKVEIVCQNVAIKPVDNTSLDNLFPNWGLPHSGLARPGILAMIRLQKEQQEKRDKHE